MTIFIFAGNSHCYACFCERMASLPGGNLGEIAPEYTVRIVQDGVCEFCGTEVQDGEEVE